MLRDIEDGTDDRILFWNTVNSAPLVVPEPDRQSLAKLPDEFRHYLESAA